MKFGQALEEMEKGNKVCRTGWNGRGQYVYLAQLTPDTESVFIIHNAQGQKQPGWLASQGDMKASDWEVFVPLIKVNRVGFIKIGGMFHASYEKVSFEGYTFDALCNLREHWDKQLKLLNDIIDETSE